MAYTSSVGIALGASRAGLTLRAQLLDTLGAAVGAAVTSGFVEVGGGYYLWTYDFPGTFRGGVKFTNAADGSIQAFTAINPEELAPGGVPATYALAGAESRARGLTGAESRQGGAAGAESRARGLQGAVPNGG